MTDMGAPLAYDTIGVRLLPDGADWIVQTDVTLRAGQHFRGDVVLDLSASPLSLERVEGGPVAGRDVVDQSELAPFVKLSLGDPETHDWDDLSVAMTFRWSPGGVPSGRDPARGFVEWEAPCLVLPDMMPGLLVTDRLLHGPRSDPLPRVVLRAELPPGLSLGWIASGDRSGSPPDEMLQTVIFPAKPEAPQRERAPLAVSGVPSLELSVAQQEQARAFASPLLRYLETELGSVGLVHPVLRLTDRPTPPLYPSAGAYAAFPPEQAGARKANVGRPVPLIHLLAQGWFGGGVRISGENKLELTTAIGGALGLRWLQMRRYAEVLESTLQRSEEALEQARNAKEWRPIHRILAIQLPLFRALEAAKVRETVRALLRDHWGSYLPQDRLIEALRAAGVSVPGVYM